MIIEKSKTEYSCCRIPGLALTQKGTLLAYYECRKSVSDWAQIDLKIIRSTDGGESFETVLLIHGNRKTLNNPMITVKGSEVHFFYCENYKKVYHRVSFDDGKTFGAANDISAVFENAGFFYNVVAIGPGHGIVHGGKIILQRAVEIKEGDTPEILQKRVMEEAEWQILPMALEMVCKERANA